MPTPLDSQVPRAVLARFGSGRARPRVRWVYTSLGGVQRLQSRPVLTTAVALELRGQGVSMIELAWRWRRVRMTVTLGRGSVWGADGPPTPQRPDETTAGVAPAA